VASEFRLTLYKIDLAAVVSKYIGETEKDLAASWNCSPVAPRTTSFAGALCTPRSTSVRA
jgi:hypothetical protein